MDEFFLVLRVLVSLAAVLGVLWWLRRKVERSRGFKSSNRANTDVVNVVGRAGLAGKSQIVIADVGGYRYVLGVSEQGVTLIDTQDAPETEDLPVNAVARDTPPPPVLRDLLGSRLPKILDRRHRDRPHTPQLGDTSAAQM